MALRDWVFDRTTGEYLTDRPAGIPWGRKERDGTKFVMIRKDIGAALAATIRTGAKYLTGRSGHIVDNVYSNGTISDAPASYARIVGPRFLNIRTGNTVLTESDAWANAQAGDSIFVHKHAVLADNLPGTLFFIKSVSPRRFIARRGMTFGEAQAWAS